MGLDIASTCGPAKALLEIAGQETGEDLPALLARGSRIRETRILQPALTAVCLGVMEALYEAMPDLRFDFVAGHSLGELSAWSAAGWMGAEDTVRLAAKRGTLMQEHVEGLSFEGAMLALTDLPGNVCTDDVVAEARAAAGPDAVAVAVAARNAPSDLVVTGPADAMRTLAGRYGGKLLSVSGPWHSPCMGPVVAPFREAISGWPTQAPQRARILSNRDGAVVAQHESLADLLADQLVRPVAWAETLAHLGALGVTQILAIGPGRVLRHHVRRNPRVAGLPVLTTETRRDVARAARTLDRYELA